jgi:hypothetical protein
MGSLGRLLKAHDRGKLSHRAVSDSLAKLNFDVHRASTDHSVGPRCIVAWRFRKGGRFKGGGGQQFYTGIKADDSSPVLPSIMTGFDMVALCDVVMAHSGKRLEALVKGKPAPDFCLNEVNAALARLPSAPDENLR